MKPTGEIAIISGDELMYYNNGFGLNGLITSVEIMLEERKNFSVNVVSSKFETFDLETFNKNVALSKANNAIYGEYFLNG